MTPETLRQAGALLYGERWQEPLARDIGVAGRTMRRWVAGQWNIPEGAVDDILDLLRDRGEDISRFLSDTKQG